MIGVIDIVVVVVLALSILFALYRGLVRELLGIAAWILAAFAALYSYEPMKPLMLRFIEDPTMAGICGSLAVALVVLIVMTIINANITMRLRKSVLSGLDRTLGFAFGILRGLLLIAVVYIGASMVLSGQQLRKLGDENISMPYIHMMARWVKTVFPETMRRDMETYEQAPDDTDEPTADKKVAPVPQKKPVDRPIYTDKERQSLDDMIETIVDGKNL